LPQILAAPKKTTLLAAPFHKNHQFCDAFVVMAVPHSRHFPSEPRRSYPQARQ